LEFRRVLFRSHRGQQDAALVSVRDEIGRTCARYFDTRQNRWRVSGTSQDLYQFWYNQSGRSLAAKAGAEVLLKPTWQEAAAAAARNLPYSSRQLPLVIHHLLGQLLGWASWCRGVDWRAALSDSHESGNEQFCAQLATIWLIHEAHALASMTETERESWQNRYVNAFELAPASGNEQALWVWHRAYELAWQSRFLDNIRSGERNPPSEPDTVAEVQAAFCIDVRSEVIRRQLEQVY